MDLFDYLQEADQKENAPLAYRMRPTTLSEFYGQEHILGEGKMLRRLIEADRVRSLILYGPPGTGKTSLANVIAHATRSEFVVLNATTAAKKDLQQVVEQAKKVLKLYGKKTILFLDEIHRFNKAQQDYLLPFVEEGIITLIGATTENPYFEVNAALLSRSSIFQLKPLTQDALMNIIDHALAQGFPNESIEMTQSSKEHLVRASSGDARRIYQALELAVLTTKAGVDGVRHIDLAVIEDCLQTPCVRYDKGGDQHYDTISAFIKSMRGSDPDATLYYLAKMLYAGEDVSFIARRIMICAAEDVSIADPMALVVATNAAVAVERIGMPEGRIILAQAATYVAMAEKSNATYLAIDKALSLVKQGDYPIPPHLRDAHYSGAKELGHGKGYCYAHDSVNHYVKQQYLPDALVGTVLYEPTHLGREGEMAHKLQQKKEELDA